MRITIITPTYNAAPKLERTMHSILDQHAVATGAVDLQYIVCDDGSADDSVAVARRVGGDRVEVVTEPHRGLYPTLLTAFGHATGDVVSWLGAGDWYHPSAFNVLADVFADPQIDWVTGMSLVCRADGVVVRARNPYRYRSRLFRVGAYGRQLPMLQQESTFWRRHLLDHIPAAEFSTYVRAGDAYLWSVFAEHAQLHSVYAVLGSFRVEPGQLSEDNGAYLAEYDKFARPLGVRDRALIALDSIPWHARRASDLLPFSRYLHFWDPRRHAWR